ncbi:disintegrin and metalloproteinase domain-containing protein 32 isoform X3 [Dasypus novemcinctus]|uniref:disintegrin and metalloproteinase domain-containing protein 32 isoform X3 n=1 Tax=Dasypus novemcinctus TaxID=9361 RepID=UPI00265F1E81|nr:disintegrin and metalloproteinase domain-containing protein 32 isoform X3 [Dasypus novemcinctus]
MFRLMMLFAGLGDLLVARPDSKNLFPQIIFPEKIQANTSDNSEVEYEQISYIIPIDEKPYTVHLKQRFFLSDNFVVYLYNQGSVHSRSSDIQYHCYYQGYIEGYPNSVATLSTCSGLRGILQFENVSYGIEPLESAVDFQHVLYKLRNENNEFPIFTENSRSIETNESMDSNIFISGKSESTVKDLFPLYLEMNIVVDKALYDYLGSDNMIVTNKIIEIIGLVNSMFTQFKVTVVLSSLELWSDKNKISTAGEADELLHRFLKWKQSYLTLRPHDIAYLFIYRDYPDYVGATFSGKMCVTHYSAGIILQCGPESCCDHNTCTLKAGAQCYQGLCCDNCQIVAGGTECRPKVDPECDISEFCNGSSSECDRDVTIHNGHTCKGGRFFCYDGKCHDLDERCANLFGVGSRNAPFACYEEIQAQTDRFGNCGRVRSNFKHCGWRNLICGRLICTYPSRTPFQQANGAVIYARVRDSLCVTVDYRLEASVADPMMVLSGSHCDTGRICVEGNCVESRILHNESTHCSQKCNGNGVCNSLQQCHCNQGFLPPDCSSRSRSSGKEDIIMERAFRRAGKNWWLLASYISLPIIVTIIIVVKWIRLKKLFNKEEESLSSESGSEGSPHTYASRSESSSQTFTSRSRSEGSTQTGSRSQGSNQTYTSSN